MREEFFVGNWSCFNGLFNVFLECFSCVKVGVEGWDRVNEFRSWGGGKIVVYFDCNGSVLGWLI